MGSDPIVQPGLDPAIEEPRRPVIGRRGRFLCVALALIVHVALITYGTGQMFEVDLRSMAFDSLADSLLHGDASVDPRAIDTEGQAIGDKVYMYFAPFPALLRIALHDLYPTLWGRWARVSCILAIGVLLVAFVSIVNSSLSRNEDLSRPEKLYLAYISFFALAIGSPLVFLSSCAYIYHESILWALAWTTVCIALLSRLSNGEEPSRALLLQLSAATGGALLSKVTFGGSTSLAFGVVTLFLLFEDKGRLALAALSRHRARLVAVASIPLLIAALFYGWYNLERFGSPFKIVDQDTYMSLSEEEKALIRETGDLNPGRVPGALINYFGIHSPSFSSKAPFVHIREVQFLRPELRRPGYREWVVSLLFSSSWLLLGCGWGVSRLGSTRGHWQEKLIGLSFFAQTIPILFFVWMTHRYSSEFLPFLIFGYSTFLARLRLPAARRARIIAAAAFTGICVFCVFVNILSSLSWTAVYNWAAASDERRVVQDLVREMDGWF